MSGRLVVVDGDQPHDVFEVVELTERSARVRSALWFEIGEQLAVRIERDGKTTEATARVRAHVGPADAKITELELIPA